MVETSIRLSLAKKELSLKLFLSLFSQLVNMNCSLGTVIKTNKASPRGHKYYNTTRSHTILTN